MRGIVRDIRLSLLREELRFFFFFFGILRSVEK
jgi:hypothetical protein